MSSQGTSGQAKLPFTLQTDEHLEFVARRHWVYLAVKIGRDIILGLVPAAIFAGIVSATAGWDGTAGKVFVAILVLWLVFWAIKAYFTWYKYQNDVWIVTNQRLVDSLKTNWFNHRMSSADLVNVEDMSIDRSGLFATVFKYGSLICQTAGSRENFVLAGIPNPGDVLSMVDRLRDEARRDLIRGNPTL